MRFNAFISYSRAPDVAIAAPLEKALEQFARKWYQRRALRVCLDVSDLPVSPGLRTSIESHLAQSEFLIFLARPESARSEWVCRELQWWLVHRPIEKLLLVRTGGTIRWSNEKRDFEWDATTALPRCIGGAFAEEPAYVEVPPLDGDQTPDWNEPRFRQPLLKLAAALHGRPADELEGADLERHRHLMRAIVAAACVFIVLIAVAVVSAYRTSRSQGLARRNEQAFETERRRNEAKRLSRIAKDSTNDAKLSLLLGLEAVGATYRADRTATPEAQEALNWAIQLDGGIVSFNRRWLPRSGTEILTADGQALASATGAHLELFDLPTGAGRRLSAGQAPLAAVAFADDHFVAVDHRLAVWKWTFDGQHRETVRIAAGIPIGIALSADGRSIAWYGTGGALFLSEGGSAPPRALECGRGQGELSFSQDGGFLLVTTSTTIFLCDLTVGTSIELPADDVSHVASGPRALHVAAVRGFQILLWKSPALDRAGSALTGHLAEIRALAFSGDGQLLASGDTSGTVRLWNAESETLELEFQRPGHMIESMTFSVDGHFLAVKSDQSLTMYPTTLTELIVEAYRHVGSRRLTNDECARYLQMKACPPAP